MMKIVNLMKKWKWFGRIFYCHLRLINLLLDLFRMIWWISSLIGCNSIRNEGVYVNLWKVEIIWWSKLFSFDFLFFSGWQLNNFRADCRAFFERIFMKLKNVPPFTFAHFENSVNSLSPFGAFIFVLIISW